MRAHDRAAARNVRRFTLTVCRYSNGCIQFAEFPSLTEREVEERKALEREMMPECPWGTRSVTFDVEAY